MSRGHALPQAEFGELFQELLTTRAHYETLRIEGAPFGQRAEMLERLHSLRSNMGRLRNS
jgi:hypothetical protein